MRPMRFALALLRRFARSERGNFAMMFGLIALPLMGFIGLATDVTRAYMARVALQGACDTAALAAATLSGQSKDVKTDMAKKYFYSNYSSNYWAPLATPVVTITNQVVTVEATATQTNFFVRLFGYNTFDIAANATAMSPGKGLELAMVLDITGSMCDWGGPRPCTSGTKITALKDASTQLINTVFGEDATSDMLRIGIVPFSASVKLDPATAVAGGWIDTNGTSSVAKLNYDTSYANNYAYALYKTPSGAGYMNNISWAGCVEARPSKLDETDTAPAAGDTRWVPFMAPDNADNLVVVSRATTANITLSGTRNIDGQNVNSGRILVKNQTTARNNGIYDAKSGAWTRATDADTAGEVHQLRIYVQSGNTNGNTQWNQTANVTVLGGGSGSTVTFTKQTDLSPTANGGDPYDNNYIADVGNATVANSNRATQDLRKQRYTAKYQNASPNTAYGPDVQSVNRQCVPSPIIPLGNAKAPLVTAIANLAADGHTHIPLGIGWGWRLLSPTQPYTQGAAYTDPNWDKVLVIETDGANTMPDADHALNGSSSYTAYGFADQARLGAGIDTTNEMATEMNESMKRTCAAINALKKPNGTPAIKVYTIGFGAEANQATNRKLLEDCATTKDLFFYAPNEEDLKDIFAQIANELSLVRLTK